MYYIILIVTGLGAGFLSGLLGVGGGSILVPVLVYVLHTEMHIAVGTSLALIVPAAITGSLTHYRNGNIDLHLFALMAVGSIIGATLGANAAQVLPASVLRKLFAVLMIFTALRMLK